MYLAELLISKGYKVFGLIRGQHNPKQYIVKSEIPKVALIEGDLTDFSSLLRALQLSKPDEVYNLAAWSFVGGSFNQPVLTAQVTGVGVLNLLEAIRVTDSKNKIRFYQASTSELYGKVIEPLQDENTPLHPRSPYANAKAFGHYTTINYRESYGMFACAGILFNHESPRRGYEFVTRKVTSSVARIKLGLQKEIIMGNIDAKRDWGFAGDYVRGMWLMLQQKTAEEYVLATGQTRSIRKLLDSAFKEIGISDWAPYIKQDKRFMRPAEVELLHGKADKANKKLGWKTEVSFQELIHMMVQNDLDIESKRKLTF
jgi:GDPmannose 4,6-dehydratase